MTPVPLQTARAPSAPIRGSHERVVYAGSAGETLAPGLHRGWIVVPHGLVDRSRRFKEAANE